MKRIPAHDRTIQNKTIVTAIVTHKTTMSTRAQSGFWSPKKNHDHRPFRTNWIVIEKKGPCGPFPSRPFPHQPSADHDHQVQNGPNRTEKPIRGRPGRFAQVSVSIPGREPGRQPGHGENNHEKKKKDRDGFHFHSKVNGG